MAVHDPEELSNEGSALRRRRAIALVGLLIVVFGAAAAALATRGDGHDPAWLTTTRILGGHRRGVAGLAASPDGRTLAAAAGTGWVRLWDTSSWSLVGELPGHTRLLDVVFSPDSRILVTAGEDGSVSVWNAERRALVRRLRAHRGWVLDVAFSNDGAILATAGDYYYGDGLIQLWDLSRLERIGRPIRAFGVAMWFGDDGRTLTFLNAIGEVKDYDVLSHRPPRAPTFDTGALEYGNGKVSPDGSKLILVNENGTLMLWDVLRRPPRNLPLRVETYQSWSGDPVAFAPDGRTFASASTYRETIAPQKPQTVLLWDVARRAPRAKPLQFDNRRVTSMEFSPDGRMLAVGGSDGTVRIRTVASQ